MYMHTYLYTYMLNEFQNLIYLIYTMHYIGCIVNSYDYVVLDVDYIYIYI